MKRPFVSYFNLALTLQPRSRAARFPAAVVHTSEHHNETEGGFTKLDKQSGETFVFEIKTGGNI